jgi:hypothetical protein
MPIRWGLSTLRSRPDGSIPLPSWPVLEHCFSEPATNRYARGTANYNEEYQGMLTMKDSKMRKALSLEIHVLRAERSNDDMVSVFLDLAEVAKGDPLLPLMTTLQLSAGFAASDGLSEKQWMQQVRNRHAVVDGNLEALIQALEILVADRALPWSEL